MWGNKKSVFSTAGETTLISRQTVIVGDVQFRGNLDIEGVVKGNVIAESGVDSLVRVVDKGRVEGEIRVPSVIVNGAVEGDVHSSKNLELAARGRVQGDVFYNLLEMAAGSEVNGSLSHRPNSAGSQEKGDKAVNPSVEVSDAGDARPIAAGVQPKLK